MSAAQLFSDDTTSAGGALAAPTFIEAITARLRYGLATVHFYVVRADGQMLCLGCGKPIIQTAYGDRTRVLGGTVAWDEKACGGVERGEGPGPSGW